MEDGVGSGRIRSVEQRVLENGRVAGALSLAALVAASVLLPARLGGLRGAHDRWRGRRPCIV